MCANCWRWWCCCARAPRAQTLPFVEPGGLIHAELRYSQVVSSLGDPPRSREKWMPGDPSLGGSIVFEYPAQGLGFVVPANERPKPDPRVAYLLVRSPATAGMPEGIGIGMSLDAVRPLVRAGDAVPQGSTLAWSGSPGAGPRQAQLHFDTARTLELMVFDSGLPRGGITTRWLQEARVVSAYVLVFAMVLGLPWFFKGYFERERRRLRAYAPMRQVLGTGMFVLAPLLMVLGGVVTAGSDGFVRLLGVLMLVGGAGLVLTGAYNQHAGGRAQAAVAGRGAAAVPRGGGGAEHAAALSAI